MAADMQKPRPVYVQWLDSVRHSNSWTSLSEFVEAATFDQMLHHTLGYLIGENDDSLIVALSISHTEGDPNVVDVIQIPAVAVLDRHWVDLPAPAAASKSRRSTAASGEADAK